MFVYLISLHEFSENASFIIDVFNQCKRKDYVSSSVVVWNECNVRE